MEEIVSPSFQKQPTSGQRCSSRCSSKDLWIAVREGCVDDVDSCLTFLKKSGGNLNARNPFGLTPLHIATWRNHIPIVNRLLAAGADPNVRDGESGWSSLHRALHFGHLAAASVLLQSGASITVEDSKSRTPVDLLSGPIEKDSSGVTEVFSWGSGVNYQLGTGNAHIQKLPCKVDSLHGSVVKLISAAKFHSIAVTSRGEVYTWGFGRGGRLGHPEFDIHSGQAAVITPRQVISGLGARHVKAVAAAKHHTVVATEAGEVFTWGSNREGQLGYTSVDTQPTPRRVSSLKSRVVAVAAANKHTAAVTDTGEVYTWGCNKEGQLGYGTSNSASNYAPRVVEYLKGKTFTQVAAAKYHTIVLGSDGEVFTWGHRLVTPKRVIIARNAKKVGNTPLKFHRKHAVAIAAGTKHSVALADDGALFYWVSSDHDLKCLQLYSLCGRDLVSISAGKYWIAAVTVTGDVYLWDAKEEKDRPPSLTRLHGVKKATSVSVGETHLLIISSLYQPAYLPHASMNNPQKLKPQIKCEMDELDEGFMFDDDIETDEVLSPVKKEDRETKSVPSLKSLCEKLAADYLVEPRTAIPLLEISDSLGADDLRNYCEDIAIRNLDYILTVSGQTIANTSLDILFRLEKLLDLKSSEPWSSRRLPTPTAPFPAILNSEEETSDDESLRARECSKKKKKAAISREQGGRLLDKFMQSCVDKEAISKQVRALRKKLQQIEMLEEKQSKGKALDAQQLAKLQTKLALEHSLSELGVPVTISGNGKPTTTSKELETSKRQRRKNKQNPAQLEVRDSGCETIAEPPPPPSHEKGCTVFGISPTDYKEVKHLEAEAALKQDSNEPPSSKKKEDLGCSNKSIKSSPMLNKKKNRKGGLSMFLSGGLDKVSKFEEVPPPPPVSPKVEAPAWGGAKMGKGSSTSLREIQNEQNKVQETKHVNNKKSSGQGRQLAESPGGISSGGRIQLSAFLSSDPVPVDIYPQTTAQMVAPDAERNSTPPWAAAATSAGTSSLSRPSLRDIQSQQQGRKHHNHKGLSQSPKVKTAGFSVIPSGGQGSLSDSSSSGLNRWFKPEVEMPSSIHSIQIEERAIKDLKRFYSSVKVVMKNQ
ncbi:unnamed protein product [Cuscuta epithymum]|uniref:Inhibitor of Bruton tyrosine kinase n=1 Tax=Cuscuta epithymum TaxID=186058 RepID=A0AAV0EMN0_9ASTE|nr:unnamed protein product [Cuscuta epithymum]